MVGQDRHAVSADLVGGVAVGGDAVRPEDDQAARILGLRSVPLMIRHDGRVQTGAVNNLAGWLAGKDDQADQALGAVKDKTKESKEAAQ